MPGLVIRFASMMCLLAILTGPSSALHGWQLPAVLVLPTYPSNPNDPYYQAFQTVPPLDVTAKKLITNFLGYSQLARITKRQVSFVDTVIVLDGSGSVSPCAFLKAKEGLKRLIDTPLRAGVDAKYAAVTFSTTATVNFNFSPVSSASSQTTTIRYPGGSTNTQAGLREAKNLFDDPFSGRRYPSTKRVILVTDGRSNVRPDLTIPNANALKASGVTIFVVAVGNSIPGIDEMVRIVTNPNDGLWRVQDYNGFGRLVDLVVRMVSPGSTYQFVNYRPPCN